MLKNKRRDRNGNKYLSDGDDTGNVITDENQIKEIRRDYFQPYSMLIVYL